MKVRIIEETKKELKKKVSLFVKEITSQYDVDEFRLSVWTPEETGKNDVMIDMISASKPGIAPFIIQKLCDWADMNHIILGLMPDDSFGTAYYKLVKFYKFYGFEKEWNDSNMRVRYPR